MKKAITLSIVFLLLIAITVVLHLNRSTVYATLDSWKLIPRKEHFTELYFVTYPTLAPSNVVVGTKIPFSFEVRNMEEKDTDYPYMVYYKGSDQRTVLIDRGVMTLKNGESGYKSESFTMPKKGSLVGNVIVYLSDLDRYIYFSVPNKNLILDSMPVVAAPLATTTLGATTTTPRN